MSRMPPSRRRRGPAATPAVAPRPNEHELDVDWARAESAVDAPLGPGRREALTTASHEIRTPLAAIVGLADLLGAETLTPAQAALVRAIGVSGRSLLSLVDDILDISRADLGRLRLAPEPTALAPFLEDVVELIAPRAHAKGLELALSVTGRLPAEVMVDAGRLRQVLLNLIGNAVKFTTIGGVELAVAAGPRRRGLVRLAIAVNDSGPGIAAADQARVFAAFEQAADAGASRRDGVGLGLAIARAIVEVMGGTLRLDSTPGAGARFAFTLDLPASAPPAQPRRLAGRAVLVLAPGRFEPAAWCRALGDAGAEALAVDTVWDARRALVARRFDVMLVDHSAALDAAAVLNDIGPDRPPALVALGPADRPALPRFLGAGFAGHLVKPIRAATFARVLGRVLEASPQEATDTATPAPPRLPLSVLVVEDDEISALLARTLLLHLGARPHVVADGPAALAAWTAASAAGSPYDLALVDQHLPGLDGPATIAALRGAPGGSGARIVAVTAEPGPEAAAAARDAGADRCLVKPLDADTLVAAAG